MQLKVMSYNVHSGIDNTDTPKRNYDNIYNVIKASGADIIGLQEVGSHPFSVFAKWEGDGLPNDYLAEKLGYNGYFGESIFLFNEFPYGNSLLTKFKIKSSKTVIIPDPEDKVDNGYFQTRSILVAELDVKGGLTVLVTHFGVMESEKINAVNTLIDLINEIKTPIIFMGDLNMQPSDVILKPLFNALQDVSQGKNTPFTFPSNVSSGLSEYEAKIKEVKVGEKPQMKIDYIFHTEELKVKGEGVIQSLASDHLPYVVDFEF